MKAGPVHQEFRNDLLELIRKYYEKLSSAEMLAISAYMTGQFIAMQDQRTMSPEKAMKIVAGNIELGNKEAIEAVLGNPKGSG